MGIFERMKLGTPLDTEEIRFDLLSAKPLGIEYTGLAVLDSDISSLVWSIIKSEFDGEGQLMRECLFQNVSWNNRHNL